MAKDKLSMRVGHELAILGTEDRGIWDDVGDVVQHVSLSFDEIRFAETDGLDQIRGVAGWIFEDLDLGNDQNQINVHHRLAHQTRHVTKTSDPDLEFPIDDLVVRGRVAIKTPLVPVFRPVDYLGVLTVFNADLLTEGVIALLPLPPSQSTDVREAVRLLGGLGTKPVVPDP